LKLKLKLENEMNFASQATGTLVDTFGAIKAAIADSTTELDAIKQVLIARHGESKTEGEVFRLSLTHSLTTRVDWKAVASVLAKKANISDKVLDNIIADASNCTDAWVARSAARVTK
jgi:hypothetical protein